MPPPRNEFHSWGCMFLAASCCRAEKASYSLMPGGSSMPPAARRDAGMPMRRSLTETAPISARSRLFSGVSIGFLDELGIGGGVEERRCFRDLVHLDPDDPPLSVRIGVYCSRIFCKGRVHFLHCSAYRRVERGNGLYRFDFAIGLSLDNTHTNTG